MSAFVHRGIVEGYYGPPYAHRDRLWWIEQLGRWGMNLYVYAPKDDRLQREQWRTPYPGERLREFAELVERGEQAGVAVGFSVSPGLSMRYSSADDVATLRAKLVRFRELGARFVSLGLDDVPATLTHDEDRRAFRSLADAHAALAHALCEALGEGCRLWLVPTDYIGVGATDYLEVLGRELDPAVEVGWTGRTVVSPSIDCAEAAQRAATLRRRLLLWDNVPVADGPMRPLLHLGPYVGREAGLARHLSGVLLNTMQHARASAVAVRTAADYLRDPETYDPERSWRDALAELGSGAEGAFLCFAAAHRFSALLPGDRDAALERAWQAVREAAPGSAGEDDAIEGVITLLVVRRGAADAIRAGLRDRLLAAELEPWLASHRQETERMLAAAECLRALASDAPRMRKAVAFLGFEAKVQRLGTPAVASYGPRRVLYPQLASLRDADAHFGSDPGLFLGCCLADDAVQIAEQRARELLGVRRAAGTAPSAR